MTINGDNSWMGLITSAPWNEMIENYERAVGELLTFLAAPEPQCAPAIGVHERCDHDDRR